MAHILIRDEVPELELLLAAVMKRAGHQAVPLGRTPEAGVEGDLLLVAPTSLGAVEWVAELRRRRPDLPIVCVGPDPADPSAEAIRPTTIVQKPFHIAELSGAVEHALHAFPVS